jgi:prepilin-type N-terminal cleavage/methylation domain-containing protein
MTITISSARELKPGVLRTVRRGFTLLELLIVMALTVILLGLIFGPLISSFNLTSRARTQIESQTAARDTMRLVTRLLSNAVFVYDNGQTPLNLWFQDKSGAHRYVPTLFTMVEYVSPARQLDQVPGNLPIDPTTGQPIYPPDKPNQSGFAVPLSPGRSLGRLFIGLLDNTPTAHSPVASGQDAQNGMPAKPYANRFENPAQGQDNRYALFRAEVSVYVPNSIFDPSDTSGKYVVDTRLFHTDDNGAVKLHDPNFFYDNSLAGDGSNKYALPGWRDANGDGKVEIAENWRAVASPVMPIDKLDMVTLDRDDANNVLYFKNNQPSSDDDAMPRVRPLVTFSPTFLQNDPGTPTSLSNAGNEAPAPAPTTYTTTESHWAQPYRVLVYRDPSGTADPLSLASLDYYQYVVMGDGSVKIVHQTGVAPGATPPDPTGLPDVGPMINDKGFFTNPNMEFAFTVDPERGIVNFAFPASVLVNDGEKPLPARYSPVDINAGLAAIGKRYLWLRAPLPTANYNGQPLNPLTAVSPLDKFKTDRGQPTRVRIVPGSERVYGPDQRPGPTYGYRTLYTRVSATAGVIGPNEYKINYEDVPNADKAAADDPRVRIGFIEFNSLPDQTDPLSGQGSNSLPLAKYNPATGQVDPSLPADPVEVTYDFQMNRANDVVKVDYLTRTLMNVAVQARLYDPASSRPQLTDLTNRIRIGNLQR